VKTWSEATSRINSELTPKDSCHAALCAEWNGELANAILYHLHGNGLNALVHHTSFKSLAAILESGKILPRNHIANHPKPTVEMVNHDVAYMSLMPNWAISPKSDSLEIEVSHQVAIEIPIHYLATRSDWHLNENWHYGKYLSDSRSARPCEMDKFVGILLRKKLDMDQFVMNNMSSQKLDFPGFIKFLNNFPSAERMLKVQILQNEVIFPGGIDLSRLPIKINFQNRAAMDAFISNHSSIFTRMKELERGQNIQGSHFIIVSLGSPS
jgi:hypothetical protein